MRSPSRLATVHAARFAVALALLGVAQAWCADDPYRLQLEVHQVGDAFDTHASFRLPLTQCQAWHFIVDYDAAVQVPGVISSRTLRLGPSRARVERTLRETVLFFPIHMRTVLEFTEIAGQGTDFVQVEGEARMHRGSWRLEPSGDGTTFRYHAISEPDSSLPSAIIRYFVEKRLRSTFAAMARQGAQRTGTDCPS